MQARFEPRPDRDRLTSTPLHVVVRDYPETLAVLRERGVDLGARGAGPLTDLDEGREALVRALLEATAWRPAAGA